MSRAPVVTLRPAVPADCVPLWRWRNDPETRRASFDQAEIPLEVHRRWFDESLSRPDRRLYIVQADGRDAGVVRLDVGGDTAIVHINLAPEWRGRGVGARALRSVRLEAFGPLRLLRLVARVKPENAASLAAFEKAGFRSAAAVDEEVNLVASRSARPGGRLCLIPARGGSKRLPRKNVALFDGTPLLVRTIDVAMQAALFDRIVVSTEDPEIALLAKRAGAEVHRREARLAADSARLVDVCRAVLADLEGEGVEIPTFCLLIPTAPFRTAAHIREAYELLERRRANAVMSVSEFPHVPFWAVHETRGVVRLFWGKRWLKTRGRLPVLYRHNGVVLWMRAAALRRYRDFYCPRVVPYHMRLEESIDIDHPLDLEFAEFLLRRRPS